MGAARRVLESALVLAALELLLAAGTVLANNHHHRHHGIERPTLREPPVGPRMLLRQHAHHHQHRAGGRGANATERQLLKLGWNEHFNTLMRFGYGSLFHPAAEKLLRLNLHTDSGNDEALDLLDVLQSQAVGLVAQRQIPGIDIPKVDVTEPKETLMDSINTLRCNVCYERPDLLHHQKCFKFLKKMCKEGRICTDVCDKFKKQVAEGCWNNDDEFHSTFCDVYRDVWKSEAPKPGDSKDSDGDGTPDSEDAFPNDPKEWKDTDGDGIGDNSDDDIDGDGRKNGEDKFPLDPKEWEDTDGDGIGDNSDEDIDGDGLQNKDDPCPKDKSNSCSEGDMDNDGIPDDKDPDKDGDGVDNAKDAFPDDPKEWKDTDGDGIGDNSDEDADNDGVPNVDDAFPLDRTESKDLDGDGIGDNSDPDIDGDGHDNDKDHWPRDPTKWADLDEDGMADNEDPDIDGDSVDNGEDVAPTDPTKATARDGSSHSSGNVDPATLNKVIKGLPDQGYDERSLPDPVQHVHGDTYTGDWIKEWPKLPESERETIAAICKDNPQNTWCGRYKKHGQFAR